MRGRPRKHDVHLPANVYRSNNAYYLAIRGAWRWLGRTEAAALEALKNIPLSADEKDILKFTRSLIARTRQNCKKRRQLLFSLTTDDVRPLLDAAGWQCAVTGTPFSLQFVGRKRPYAPSIDRIDNAVGYTLANCRIVCAAANIAMNEWGAEVLRHLAHHMRRNA